MVFLFVCLFVCFSFSVFHVHGHCDCMFSESVCGMTCNDSGEYLHTESYMHERKCWYTHCLYSVLYAHSLL